MSLIFAYVAVVATLVLIALKPTAPSQHHDGLVRATKADATVSDEHFNGKTSPSRAKSTSRRSFDEKPAS